MTTLKKFHMLECSCRIRGEMKWNRFFLFRQLLRAFIDQVSSPGKEWKFQNKLINETKSASRINYSKKRVSRIAVRSLKLWIAFVEKERKSLKNLSKFTKKKKEISCCFVWSLNHFSHLEDRWVSKETSYFIMTQGGEKKPA